MEREEICRLGSLRKIKESIFINIAGSSNGRTWAFEAQYVGSIPTPAVNTC